ncbi:unnamed protein product, partial [Prorocentrum cordatum]
MSAETAPNQNCVHAGTVHHHSLWTPENERQDVTSGPIRENVRPNLVRTAGPRAALAGGPDVPEAAAGGAPDARGAAVFFASAERWGPRAERLFGEQFCERSAMVCSETHPSEARHLGATTSSARSTWLATGAAAWNSTSAETGARGGERTAARSDVATSTFSPPGAAAQRGARDALLQGFAPLTLHLEQGNMVVVAAYFFPVAPADWSATPSGSQNTGCPEKVGGQLLLPSDTEAAHFKCSGLIDYAVISVGAVDMTSLGAVLDASRQTHCGLELRSTAGAEVRAAPGTGATAEGEAAAASAQRFHEESIRGERRVLQAVLGGESAEDAAAAADADPAFQGPPRSGAPVASLCGGWLMARLLRRAIASQLQQVGPPVLRRGPWDFIDDAVARFEHLALPSARGRLAANVVTDDCSVKTASVATSRQLPRDAPEKLARGGRALVRVAVLPARPARPRREGLARGAGTQPFGAQAPGAGGECEADGGAAGDPAGPGLAAPLGGGLGSPMEGEDGRGLAGARGEDFHADAGFQGVLDDVEEVLRGQLRRQIARHDEGTRRAMRWAASSAHAALAPARRWRARSGICQLRQFDTTGALMPKVLAGHETASGPRMRAVPAVGQTTPIYGDCQAMQGVATTGQYSHRGWTALRRGRAEPLLGRSRRRAATPGGQGAQEVHQHLLKSKLDFERALGTVVADQLASAGARGEPQAAPLWRRPARPAGWAATAAPGPRSSEPPQQWPTAMLSSRSASPSTAFSRGQNSEQVQFEAQNTVFGHLLTKQAEQKEAGKVEAIEFAGIFAETDKRSCEMVCAVSRATRVDATEDAFDAFDGDDQHLVELFKPPPSLRPALLQNAKKKGVELGAENVGTLSYGGYFQRIQAGLGEPRAGLQALCQTRRPADRRPTPALPSCKGGAEKTLEPARNPPAEGRQLQDKKLQGQKLQDLPPMDKKLETPQRQGALATRSLRLATGARFAAVGRHFSLARSNERRAITASLGAGKGVPEHSARAGDASCIVPGSAADESLVGPSIVGSGIAAAQSAVISLLLKQTAPPRLTVSTPSGGGGLLATAVEAAAGGLGAPLTLLLQAQEALAVQKKEMELERDHYLPRLRAELDEERVAWRTELSQMSVSLGAAEERLRQSREDMARERQEAERLCEDEVGQVQRRLANAEELLQEAALHRTRDAEESGRRLAEEEARRLQLEAAGARALELAEEAKARAGADQAEGAARAAAEQRTLAEELEAARAREAACEGASLEAREHARADAERLRRQSEAFQEELAAAAVAACSTGAAWAAKLGPLEQECGDSRAELSQERRRAEEAASARREALREVGERALGLEEQADRLALEERLAASRARGAVEEAEQARARCGDARLEADRLAAQASELAAALAEASARAATAEEAAEWNGARLAGSEHACAEARAREAAQSDEALALRRALADARAEAAEEQTQRGRDLQAFTLELRHRREEDERLRAELHLLRLRCAAAGPPPAGDEFQRLGSERAALLSVAAPRALEERLLQLDADAAAAAAAAPRPELCPSPPGAGQPAADEEDDPFAAIGAALEPREPLLPAGAGGDGPARAA